MRILKQEIYFPIIIGIHLLFWAIDLYFFKGAFVEENSDTLLFGTYTNLTGINPNRIIGEIFSSWVVTVFAANFLMATREKWVERLFGGLDKMYLIHRRSAIIAVALLILHFVFVPRDLTEFNPGKPLGFYALILILLGVIISAVPFFKKKIAYNKWLNIHKLMGVFYVMAVIHGFMVFSLIKELPITRVYVFGMAILGVVAWIYRAFLYNLFNKKLDYSISSVKSLDDKTAELTLKPTNKALKFIAGQFAFFTFPSISKKEQHPFTISSHPSDENLRLVIKGLGDYTDDIAEKLKAGEPVKVEGPFGHFTNQYINKTDQIWIAGGIGITPFLSLAKDISNQKIKLFWCVSSQSEASNKAELEALAAGNPNFEFVLWDSDNKSYLNADGLGINDFNEYAYLICGPEALKQSFMKQLKAKGVNKNNIYDEEFSFR
ncbi:MAG: hypothetical protein DRI89_15430 [Bacteroidetes bacterium]|nr:MAG: hypothetical protein DRI89_15430 [Bacteroidota bacterium]